MQLLHRSLALLALLPVFAFASACSSSNNNNNGPADAGGGGKSCATNADCSNNEVCTSDPGCTDCKFTCHVSCQSNDTCASGEWCRAEAFSHTAFCAARAAIGAGCENNSPVDPRDTNNAPCVDGAFCNGTKCVAQIASGDTCTTAYTPFECAAGSICNTIGGSGLQCNPYVQANGACKDDRDCDPALFCAAATKTCQPRVAKGGMCDESSEYMCEAGTDCKYATILDCTADRDCMGGKCCAQNDGLGVCSSADTPNCVLPKGTCQ